MSIDKSGEFWRGTAPVDLDEYLRAHSAASYPVSRIVHATCDRDGQPVFAVRIDDEQGFAERRCVECGTVVSILDSATTRKTRTPAPAACPCGGEEFNIAAHEGYQRFGASYRTARTQVTFTHAVRTLGSCRVP